MAPKRKQLDVIRLNNAVFYAYHGALDDEQNLGGKFGIDIELQCDLTKGALSDHLKDTVDYEKVYECVRKIVIDRKYFLLEALARSIAKGILDTFRKVMVVTVRIRKPNAPIKGVVDSVEVELTEHRR